MSTLCSPFLTVEDGVGTQDAVAPPYSKLRPLNSVDPGVFPVYRDLADALRKPSDPFEKDVEHPDRIVAHTLATCSGYAYSDAHTLSTMMARMGLANNRCRMIGTYVDPMLIAATAFLVQSEDGKVVILAYRGTELTNVVNWLGDLDLVPERVAFKLGRGGPYDVHAGFYRNLRAVRFKVTEALLRAQRGFPVTGSGLEEGRGPLDPMEALYITGHSLGGAMAALHSMLARTEQRHEQQFADELRATYTFAQPLVGSPGLAAACDDDDFLRERVLRFVYKNDPIPHIPTRDSGKLKNFGREFQFSNRGWRESTTTPAPQARSLFQVAGGVLATVARPFPVLRDIPFEYQFTDHGPQNYIVALTPPGVPTEFGDYNYTEPG